MSLRSEIEKLLEPIRARIRTMASKAIVNLIDDTTKIQLLQCDILKDETLSKVERVQQYGFTSVPLKDSQAVLLSINGNKEHSIAIAVDSAQYRITGGEEGEVNVYDHDGNYVKLSKSNGIEVNAPNEKVVIKAGGDIEIGNSSLKKLVNEEFQDMFNNHVHNYVGFVGTGTPTPYVTSSPAKVVGTTPVHVNATPPAPPQTYLFADDITNNEMTNKVKAQ